MGGELGGDSFGGIPRVRSGGEVEIGGPFRGDNRDARRDSDDSVLLCVFYFV